MTDKLLKLYIEPSSRCNLACKMCFRNTWIDESFSDMDMSVFRNTIDTMPESVRTVFFGGMGEPLVHESILSMVEYAANKGVRVELLTNGTLLTREMSAALLDKGLNMLWVSLDSIDEGEYEKIRINSNYRLVKSNIEAFNAERDKRQNTVEWIESEVERASLGLAFVAMKSNVRQLGRLNRFAFTHGVSEINVSNISPTDRESQNESLCSRTVSLGLGAEGSGNPRINLPAMDSNVENVRDGLMSLFTADFDYSPAGSETLARRRRYCRFINEGIAFVRHDGDVSPCIALLHTGVTYLFDNRRVVSHHSFGNTGTHSLADIWESEEYSAFRTRVKEFDFSPCVQCGGCDNRDENLADCFGNTKPTCGACLWSEGVLSCP